MRSLVLPALLLALLGAPLAAATFRFEAEGPDFTHDVGRPDSDGWSADPSDGPGWLLKGPGTDLVHAGFAQIRLRARIGNPAGSNDPILRLEVVDRASGTLAASRVVRRHELPGAGVDRTFLLEAAVGKKTYDLNVWTYAADSVSVGHVDAVTDERPLSRYGVNAHVPDDARIDAAAAAHLRWLRIDLNWVHVEPSQGAYDWSAYDAVVDSALRHGQHVLACLAFTPDWATSGPTLTHPPDDMGDWFDFVYWTATHFKGRVAYWSIWNEPNLTRFFTGTRGDYINMLKVAAQAIRQADPDAFVVGPELSDLNSADWDDWLDDVLATCRSDVDIVAHHIYDDDVSEIVRILEGPRYPWEPKAVLEIMEDNGMDDTPLWLTETGWTSDEFGEQGQANRIVDLLHEMTLRPWWARTFLYELADPPGSPTLYGILREDLTPKIGYVATWSTALEGAREAWILAAPGAGPGNPPYVLASTWDGYPAMWLAAYGSTGFGARVAGGVIDPAGREKVLTGPGPGVVYGPQVRAFEDTGDPIAKVSFYAYGTLKFGVNVEAGDLDGDSVEEVVTGAGPGVIFGPHVRAWDYDGGSVAPFLPVNFFAYATPRYGVNVAAGSPDGDFYDELVTGPGPASSFGGQIRGWNVDGVRLTAMPGLNAFAYPVGSWGCEVEAMDLDGDGVAELAASPGPTPSASSEVRTFTYDGTVLAAYHGLVAFPGSLYGAHLGALEVDGGGPSELAVSVGPDPGAAGAISLWTVPAPGPALVPGSAPFTPFPGYGYGADVGALRLD